MSVDLSRVNVSIQQFQDISSGKYNAGEVKLESETKLGKINHHVHLTGSNAKSLSHQEVLAIKNAFVKALSSHGVAGDEIDRIRRDLGLSAEAGTDKSLHERSLRPLTRQQVRQILDRNAAAINSARTDHGDRVYIATSTLPLGVDAEAARRAERRDAVNAALAGARRTTEHGGLAAAEAVVAGDVDFRTADDSRSLVAQARAQLRQILDASKGRPSAEREAVVQFRITATGQNVRIPTGMSEAAYVRKLEELLVRLYKVQSQDARGAAARAQFSALATPLARREWLDGLANAPDRGFKIRTAAILMLTEAGIGDWETLSRINRVDDATALGLARTLVQLDGSLRGDDLRNDQAMQALARLAAPDLAADVPAAARAFVPATSSREWNESIRSAVINGRPEELPHEIRELFDELPGRMTAAFGPDFIDVKETGTRFVDGFLDKLLTAEVLDGPTLTAENLRERLNALAIAHAAERYADGLAEQAVVDAGGGHRNGTIIWNDWSTTRPQLRERLSAARSAAEVDAVFAEFGDAIRDDARRFVAVTRGCEKVVAHYRDSLARRLGVPSACLNRDLELKPLEDAASDLAEKIRRGEVEAMTDEQIDAAFRSLAETAARRRADAVAGVERMDLPPALRGAIVAHLLCIDRPDKLDVPRAVAAARAELAPFVAAIDAALVPGADKMAVYEAMKPFAQKFGAAIHSLIPPERDGRVEQGGDETYRIGAPMTMTVIYDRPGLVDKLAAFFARPDVARDDLFNPKSPAHPAGIFRAAIFKNENRDTLLDTLGKPSSMSPVHAQALMKAFDDAGLGHLSIPERMAVLRAPHPAAAALRAAIAAEPGEIPASRLRELAAPILRDRAGDAPAARSAADAARMEALLAKYDGGLSEADKASLRAFADALDFSEAAAAESEAAIAQHLDEMVGRGGFDNPASSASRRALAAGFSLADLPMLARVADVIDVIGPDLANPVESILNPRSDFRRLWDAALLSLANNRPDRLAEISAAEKIAVAVAVRSGQDDPDLLAVVTAGISRAIHEGNGHVRTVGGVERAVERVRENLRELREATEGDPAAFASGLELLKALGTRPAPAGYIKYLVGAAARAPIDALARLRRRSTPAEIHAALLQLNRAAGSTLRGRDDGGFLKDAEISLACRHFLVRAAVARLTDSQRHGLRDALASQNAAKTVAFCDAVALGNVEMPPMARGLRAHVTTLASALSRDADFLYDVVRRSLGGADAPGRLPALQGDLDPAAIGGGAMFAQIRDAALADTDAAREDYLRRTFPGASPASAAMRGLFGARLAAAPSLDPAETLGELFSGATANMLNLNVVRGAAKLATARTPQEFALTQFAMDRTRNMDVFLPGGTRLSRDPATAADEIARFVTGRPDATYAQLAGAERTKVQVVMSILTQESSTAVVEGSATALHPEGKAAAFFYGGNGGALERSFHLDRDAAGGITVRFETTLRPTNLFVGDDVHALGAGSSITGGYSLTLTAEKLDELGELDFAACDAEPAYQVMRANQPVADKLRTAVDRLPEPFRLDLEPTTTFSAVLN